MLGEDKGKFLRIVTTIHLYNKVMTFYLTMGQMEKVLLTVNHVTKMNLKLNPLTYRLWINACAATSNIDDVEKLVDELKLTKCDNIKWISYITLGNMYTKVVFQTKQNLPSKIKIIEDVEGSHNRGRRQEKRKQRLTKMIELYKMI